MANPTVGSKWTKDGQVFTVTAVVENKPVVIFVNDATNKKLSATLASFRNRYTPQ